MRMMLVLGGIVRPVELIGVVNPVEPFRIATTDGCLIIDGLNDAKRQVAGPLLDDEDVETADEDEDDEDEEPDGPFTELLPMI